MSANQQQESIYRLPSTAPDILDGSVSLTEFLPWALYCLDSEIPGSSLKNLAAELEQDFVIEVPSGEDIPLIRTAPADSLHQPTLWSALDVHIQYGNDNRTNLAYFPYGFLVAHDKDWAAQGLWLVYVDFEDDNPLTAFRIGTKNVAGACETLREGDDSADQLEKIYGINGRDASD
ncbi:hypothetical protein V2A60_001974 [Cordyceps javanica]|uniref:Uncharacterized protein n=1 Tax=Cordyceps javanica TaxID=43265 RepID=A0A545WDU0_9HYPO|nr:hypothetical protein IF1G_00873 [Cordyceps javanica]TQW12112.1 hypothetical protein IF2G_00843 [Cordyceps javanica]